VLATTQRLPLDQLLAAASEAGTPVATFTSCGPRAPSALALQALQPPAPGGAAQLRAPPALPGDGGVALLQAHLQALCQALRARGTVAGRLVLACRLGPGTGGSETSLLVAVASPSWGDASAGLSALVGAVNRLLVPLP
jgi:hypothetical protein